MTIQTFGLFRLQNLSYENKKNQYARWLPFKALHVFLIVALRGNIHCSFWTFSEIYF